MSSQFQRSPQVCLERRMARNLNGVSLPQCDHPTFRNIPRLLLRVVLSLWQHAWTFVPPASFLCKWIFGSYCIPHSNLKGDMPTFWTLLGLLENLLMCQQNMLGVSHLNVENILSSAMSGIWSKSFIRGKSVSVSGSVVPESLRPHGLQPTRLLSPWDFPGKDTGVGCHFPLQGIFPTQGSNLGLLHCRQILYWRNYKGSPGEACDYLSIQLPCGELFFQVSMPSMACFGHGGLEVCNIFNTNIPTAHFVQGCLPIYFWPNVNIS